MAETFFIYLLIICSYVFAIDNYIDISRHAICLPFPLTSYDNKKLGSRKLYRYREALREISTLEVKCLYNVLPNIWVHMQRHKTSFYDGLAILLVLG